MNGRIRSLNWVITTLLSTHSALGSADGRASRGSQCTKWYGILRVKNIEFVLLGSVYILDEYIEKVGKNFGRSSTN